MPAMPPPRLCPTLDAHPTSENYRSSLAQHKQRNTQFMRRLLIATASKKHTRTISNQKMSPAAKSSCNPRVHSICLSKSPGSSADKLQLKGCSGIFAQKTYQRHREKETRIITALRWFSANVVHESRFCQESFMCGGMSDFSIRLSRLLLYSKNPRCTCRSTHRVGSSTSRH